MLMCNMTLHFKFTYDFFKIAIVTTQIVLFNYYAFT
jgi:hypothetical protein